MGDGNTRIISARKKSERRKAERFVLTIESSSSTERDGEREMERYGALLL